MLAYLLTGSALTNAATAVGGLGVLLVIVAISLALYFLPSIIGHKKRNKWAIFALNLLLGWCVIGWVVSLIWALTKDREAPVVRVVSA